MRKTRTLDKVFLVDKPLERLPAVYADFLRLKSEGLDDPEIARVLDVPEESLPLLARLADAKLTRLQGKPGDGLTDSS